MIMTAKEIKEKNLDINNILNYLLNVDIPYQVEQNLFITMLNHLYYQYFFKKNLK